jgi:hypothetical protein
MNGSVLIYCGATIMACAVVGALISIVLFRVSKKRLMEKLKEDYGELKR